MKLVRHEITVSDCTINVDPQRNCIKETKSLACTIGRSTRWLGHEIACASIANQSQAQLTSHGRRLNHTGMLCHLGSNLYKCTVEQKMADILWGLINISRAY